MQKFLIALIFSLTLTVVLAQKPPPDHLVKRCSSILGAKTTLIAARNCPGIQVRVLDREAGFVCCAQPSNGQRDSLNAYLEWCTSGSDNEQVARPIPGFSCPSGMTGRTGNGLGSFTDRTLEWGKDQIHCCYVSKFDKLRASAVKGVSDTYNRASKGVSNTYNRASKGVSDTYNSAAKGVSNTYDRAAKGVSNTYNKAAKGVSDGYKSVSKSIKETYEHRQRLAKAFNAYKADCARNGGIDAAVDSYFDRVPDRLVICRNAKKPVSFFNAGNGYGYGRRFCCRR